MLSLRALLSPRASLLDPYPLERHPRHLLLQSPLPAPSLLPKMAFPCILEDPLEILPEPQA